MGNVMCCCKAREKFDDIKPFEDSTNSIVDSKNRSKSVQRKEDVKKKPKEKNSKRPNEPKNNKSATEAMKQIANFTTFGGESFHLHDEELKNSKNKINISGINSESPSKSAFNKTNKMPEPLQINPIVEKLDEVELPKSKYIPKSATPSPSSSKRGFLNDVESKKSLETNRMILTPSPIRNFKDSVLDPSPIKRYYFRLNIEYMDIIYKNCDDFGSIFKPFIEIKLENYDGLKIFPLAEENDKILNSSNISALTDLDNSNISHNLRSSSISGTSAILGKEKNYNFKYVKCFQVDEEDIFTNLTFVIKNEVPGTNKTIDTTLPPNIIIGESMIPINLLLKHYKENMYDGNLEIKLKCTSLIGFLKVNIYFSEKSLEGQEDFLEKMQKSKFLNVEDDLNNSFNKIIDNINTKPNVQTELNIWNYFHENKDDFNPNTLLVRFNHENLDDDLILANKVNNNKELNKLFKEIIRIRGTFSMFKFLKFLVKLIDSEDMKVITEFINNLNEVELKDFIDLPQTKCNAYILKYYLVFHYKYLRYFKQSKSLQVRNSIIIEDSALFKNVFEILNQNLEELNQTNKPEYQQELRLCLIWSLNLLNEKLTNSPDIVGGNKEILEQKKKEATIIYDNCIQIVSKRIYILRIIDFYMQDSIVIGSIFRLFRKVIQILTNENSNLLNLDKLTIPPKDFAAKFRQLIIDQNEGVYFTTLKVVLMRFQHYTELHLNILIIIFQLTNRCNKDSLIFAAERLNLSVFRDSFELYRGKLKSSNKMLNNLHLNILINFSHVAVSDDSYDNLMKLISNDLKFYYRVSQSYKRRLDDFRMRKKYEPDIHELITRLGVFATKNQKNLQNLMDSFFFDDIIEYLIIIGVGEHNDNESVNISSDFILRIKEKKKKTNLEEIKKMAYNIVDNTLLIILNIMYSPNEISDPFSTKMAEHDISTADELFELISECITLLTKYGMKVDQIEENFEILKNLF